MNKFGSTDPGALESSRDLHGAGHTDPRNPHHPGERTKLRGLLSGSPPLQWDLLLVLGITFVARFLLADWNSYWLDELLSVNVYGLWNDSVGDAINQLAGSVHPPAYQFTLYHWMSWFGDTELATRSLSNLYITLAALFLYLLVREPFTHRIALTSAVAFSLMSLPTYYALETRSYAQSMFLITLSSYLLLQLLPRLGTTKTWWRILISPVSVSWLLVNATLLLTHYYNAFVWGAQGVFGLIFVIGSRAMGNRIRAVAQLTVHYAMQGAIFGLVWGAVFIRQFQSLSGQFVLEGDPLNPLDLLLQSVVTPNINAPRLIAWIGVILVVVLLGRSIATLGRRRVLRARSEQAWMVVYLLVWLALPLFITYVAFALIGSARYSTRYFLFSVPPLAPLVILTVEEGCRWAGQGLKRLGKGGNHTALAVFISVVVIATLIVPGAQQASTRPKHDWRGIVQQVVDVVQSDSGHSYIIFETAHRREPMTNYYFERFSNDVRAYDTLQRVEERRGEYRILTVDEPAIAENDYLIVIFTHSRTSHFPNALKQLEARYEVRHRQLDWAGRGFIVYDVDNSS